MKRISAALAAFALCMGMLAGCTAAPAQPDTRPADASQKIRVVCATFPAYDWTRQVVGDEDGRYEITYLMGSGVELHSYQPTVEDIAAIASCDLFVYVGGESDGWAEDAIAAANNPDLHTVNMLAAVGDAAVEEELVEGMQAVEHDHDHEHEADHDHDHDHDHEADHDHAEVEYDEHVWLSLRNAQVIVTAIADELSAIDPDAAAAYAANSAAYCEKLAALDARYAAAVEAAPGTTAVFADRFPFRYLVDDYGISYYAAFVGCSAETEASFETVAFLAQKIDELGLHAVLVIEGSDQQIARTVVENTQGGDAEILVMDSLQSTSSHDVDGGKTYLDTMEDNLAVLTEALG